MSLRQETGYRRAQDRLALDLIMFADQHLHWQRNAFQCGAYVLSHPAIRPCPLGSPLAAQRIGDDLLLQNIR